MSDFDEYFEHAKEELFPKVEGSAITLAIVTDKPDPKICLELGAMILFDKPIVALVRPGQIVPNNLRRVASAIVEGDMNTPGIQEKLQQAISDVLANDNRKRQPT